MKIYFTASIFQKDQYGSFYTQIIEHLEKQGHKVIHEHITDVSLADKHKYSSEKRLTHYKDVVKWIVEADLVVAEVSYPSTLNVGHEVALALEKGKPVVGLYYKEKESTFFEGIQSDKFVYESYDETNLIKTLDNAIEYAHGQIDTRFNFFVPASFMTYLDWISQKEKIPRSVYLRRLIEKDMRKNKEYLE